MEKSETQAVLFFRPSWTISKSKKWLKDHNIKPILIKGKPKPPDIKLFKTQIRYRITDPKIYDEFTTQPLMKNKKPLNIHLILGWKKKSRKRKR